VEEGLMKMIQMKFYQKSYEKPQLSIYKIDLSNLFAASPDINDDGTEVDGSEDDESGDAWTDGHSKEFFWDE